MECKLFDELSQMICGNPLQGPFFHGGVAWGCLVAKWLKPWTVELEVPGSGTTGNRYFFSSGYTQQNLRGRDNLPLCPSGRILSRRSSGTWFK